jgi:hypothetical protein
LPAASKTANPAGAIRRWEREGRRGKSCLSSFSTFQISILSLRFRRVSNAGIFEADAVATELSGATVNSCNFGLTPMPFPYA